MLALKNSIQFCQKPSNYTRQSSLIGLPAPVSVGFLDLPVYNHFLIMATPMRNLKIKTSTCKRIVKELHSYEKEVEREAAKTADMKAKGSDPYDLKQQENVLAESRMMIPDCRKRLEAALSDLKATLAELEETDQKEGPEIAEAGAVVIDVEQLFQTEV